MISYLWRNTLVAKSCVLLLIMMTNVNDGLCAASGVCFGMGGGGDIPVLWWSTDSEWNKCEGSVTIFTLAGAQMVQNGDLLLSLYGRQLTTLIFKLYKTIPQRCCRVPFVVMWRVCE